MQTVEVTDEQYAVIQRLRAAISEDVVGKYGFVRERDAIQFLIDSLEAGADDLEIDVEVDAESRTATDDVAAAVETAIELGSEDVEAVSYDEDAETDDGGESDEPEEEADVTEDDPETETETETATEDSSEDDEDDSSDDDGTADTDESDDTSGAADDDDMLNKMMNLLETHDEKWEDSPSADYRYRVTLPDGSTEDVQTKDDVRALLFKNY